MAAPMAQPSLPPAILPHMPPVLAPQLPPIQPPPQAVVVVGQSPPVVFGSSSAYFNQPEQFQAAKYFTFIFFGLSCFVILLFGGFVVCHCYRRLRQREPDVPVVQMSGRPGERPAEVLITVPMKEGRLVSHPDGCMEVAYIPDSPRSPEQKSAPTTPSTGDRPPASSANDSPADSSAESPGVSEQVPTSSGAHVALGPAAAPGVANARGGVSAARAGSSRSLPAGDAEEGLTNNERLDEYWRRRHAQTYHFF